VLGRPSVADRAAIEAAMEASYQVLDRVLTGDLQKAMNELPRRA
jgi:putative sterol carrier protein